MAVEIQLTKGFVAVVDESDADLARLKWHAQTGKTGVTYAARTDRVDGKRYHLYLHRVIGERMLERSLGRYDLIDHIDGFGTNCRRNNLRLADKSGNAANQHRKKVSSSGQKGVHFEKQTGKWKAHIMIDGRSISLGRYNSIDEAAAARNHAEQKHFGEFANSGGHD